MIKPSTITQWLDQPARFSDKDRKEVAALLKTYPYFTPARYIEAAEHHKRQPFSPAMMNMMQLHMGNWLLFHEFMESATAGGAHVYLRDEEPDEYEDETGSDVFPSGAMEEMEYPDEIADDDADIDLEDFDEEESGEVVAIRDTDDEAMTEEEEVKLGYGFEEEPAEEMIPQPKEAYKEAAPPEIKPEPLPSLSDAAVTGTGKPEQPVVKKEAKEKPSGQIPFFKNRKEDSLIQPIYTEDYFLHQGLHVSDKLPADIDHPQKPEDKSLMVVMSFSEWLIHFKTKGEREKEEQQDQKALKTMWQKEKLAAALEEENDEIPENVFEMAVNSITKEEDLASESLAEIMVKQGKFDKAIDMYRKLSLRNPQKNAYFARKIDEIQKGKES